MKVPASGARKMNILQSGIIKLLKCAVTEEQGSLPETFNLESAMELIQRHHVKPLAFEGALLCGIPRQNPAMQSLFRAYCRVVQTSERQKQALQKVFAAFRENGIDYMPLKGTNLKALYPKPELRVMGDADVLIRMEQYERIVPIMNSLGFTLQNTSNHDFAWKSDALYLELHHRLIPSYDKDFFDYYGDGWQLARATTKNCFAMTPEDTFLYLFTHFAKHFREGGIGCRHVLDLWVYIRSYPELDMSYIEGELEKLRLLEFYRNIRQMISVWFDDGPVDEKTDFLTDFIFASGSWGEMESKAISLGLRNSRQSETAWGSRLRYLWDRLFPPLSELQNRYAVLKKAPCLLPAVWLSRLLTKLKAGRSILVEQNRRLELMSQENLKTRRQLLNYVGLDYYF